jgi:4-diphosphocytidyl-2-C-methyl-D-erythritol kinase
VILAEAAPAKVNLALHIRERRADGYHELDSIFAFTAFGDTLTAEAADALTLAVDGDWSEAIAGEADNLVLRAARALREAAGIGAGAALRLTKRIPVAAGLGGGSADAAAALRLLNRLWGLDWPLARLAELGETLGSDVPACVHSRTLRARGRGERMELLGDEAAGLPILLVNPRVAVPTGQVFAGWDGIDRGPLGDGDPLEAAYRGRNDLEAPALALAPAIDEVLFVLRARPSAFLSRMSGSGATCFSLYEDPIGCGVDAGLIAESSPGWWVQATHLL